MNFFSRLFSKGANPPSPKSAKTIKPGVGQFTTGSEEILMPLPQIAFTPPAGWSPFNGVKGEQKATDVRIANPSLLGKAGMITCIVFPADGLPLTEVVDRLLSKMPDTVAERTNLSSATGIPITFLHLVGPVPGKPIKSHTMHCYFVNGAGHVTSLYCVGSTEADARIAANAFLRSLRLLKAEP